MKPCVPLLTALAIATGCGPGAVETRAPAEDEAAGVVRQAAHGSGPDVLVKLVRGVPTDHVLCDAGARRLVPTPSANYRGFVTLDYPGGASVQRSGQVSLSIPSHVDASDGDFRIDIVESPPASGQYTLTTSFKRATTERTAGPHWCSVLLEEDADGDGAEWVLRASGSGEAAHGATAASSSRQTSWHRQTGAHVLCRGRLRSPNPTATYFVDLQATTGAGTGSIADVALPPGSPFVGPIVLPSGSLMIERNTLSSGILSVDARLDFFAQAFGDASSCSFTITENDPSAPVVLSSSTSLQPSAPVFRVQRGMTIIPSASVSTVLAGGIDFAVPTGPAFVRLVNTRLSGMGRTTGGASQNADRWMAWIGNVAADWTSITLNRFSALDDCRVTWELIEYTGDSAGPNAMAVRAQGALSYAAAGMTTTSQAIAGVSDDSDVVVFITGQGAQGNATTDTNRGLSTAHWDAVQERAAFTRGEAGHAATLSYAVVELTGANWTVSRVEHTHATASSIETTTFAGVGSLDRAFVHAQYRSALGGIDELGAEVWLAAADTLSFRLEPTASLGGGDMTSVVWVVGNSIGGPQGLQASHYAGSRAGGTLEEDCWQETVTAVSKLDRASIWGETARTSGTTTSTPRGSISLRMTDADTVLLCQADTGDTRTYRYSVVRWP